MNDTPLCIYHGNCLDGFTAAWAMWLKYPDAEFVPGVYGQEPPDVTGRTVFLLDFSYKRPVLVQMMRQARSITIIDHHKTAEADLCNLDGVSMDDADFSDVNCIFDMTKSGARLAWEWFHPSDCVPLFVKLVEDRDLWKFTLPNCRELNAVFFSHPYDFGVWTTLSQSCALIVDYDEMVAEGRAIERKHAKDVAELVTKLKHTREFERFGTAWIPCANLPYTMASDAANLMAEGQPFAASYYQDADGNFVFSLRSREDGADVSEVAKRYGGGGHKHAAGFRVTSLEEL